MTSRGVKQGPNGFIFFICEQKTSKSSFSGIAWFRSDRGQIEGVKTDLGRARGRPLGIKNGQLWPKNDQTNDQKNDQKNKFHPTQKPIELPERAINNSSMQGQIIYDAFLGGGSTMVAAHQLKRKCYGMELDPKYCDVIVKRWEDFTGKKAELWKP